MTTCKDCGSNLKCIDDRQEWGTYQCEGCEREVRIDYTPY